MDSRDEQCAGSVVSGGSVLPTCDYGIPLGVHIDPPPAGAVGILGFVFHGIADIHGPSKSLFENVVSGAPPIAPLLFPNLVLLGLIGLWVYNQRLTSVAS